MEDYKVSKVVEKLVGKIKPIGDSHIDEERLENLKELCEVLEYAFERVHTISDYRSSYEHSVSKVGEYAYKCLTNLRVTLCDEYENKAKLKGEFL